MSNRDGDVLRCSFCGKSQHEVRKLIAGPTVYICNECIKLCGEIIEDEEKEKVAETEVRERMVELLTKLRDNLNEKEQVILAARLLSDEPLTLQDIADQFGISRERVRQIEANLLKKMKKYLEQEVPDIHNFLDQVFGQWQS